MTTTKARQRKSNIHEIGKHVEEKNSKNFNSRKVS